jgi:hypothetical protein
VKDVTYEMTQSQMTECLGFSGGGIRQQQRLYILRIEKIK